MYSYNSYRSVINYPHRQSNRIDVAALIAKLKAAYEFNINMYFDSISSNNLSMNGSGVTVTTDSERENQVLSLPAGNNYLEAPDSINLRAGNQNFTVCAWAKFNTTPPSGSEAVVTKDNTSSREYAIFYSQSQGKIGFFIGTGGSSLTSVYASNSLVSGWNFILGEYNLSTNTVSIELNGIRTSNTVGITPGTSTQPLLIGTDGRSGGIPMTGLVDNVYIFHSVLSGAEKTFLRNLKGSIFKNVPSLKASVTSQIAAAYEFESNTTDDSLGLNDGVAVGTLANIANSFRNGKVLDLTTAGNNYVEIADANAVRGGNRDWSISMHVHFSSIPSGHIAIAAKYDYETNKRDYGIFRFSTDSKPSLYVGNGASTNDFLVSSIDITVGWNHILVGYNKTTNKIFIEVNGLRAEKTPSVTLGNSTEPSLLGTDGRAAGLPMAGLLDNVYFFHSILSTQEKIFLKNQLGPIIDSPAT